jgi:predicted amidohydrolase
MRAVAMSFVKADFCTGEGFFDYVLKTVPPGYDRGKFLLVFPAHLGLLLAYRCGDLGRPSSLAEAIESSFKLPQHRHDYFMEIQKQIARRLGAYLVPGSVFTPGRNGFSHTASLISPTGEILGYQHQIFLSRDERKMGLTRGRDAEIFETDLGKLGIIIGTDAWYPEVGRVLALKGAEVVCHCGALIKGASKWRQLAGMWQQVQQNQFFCLESQLTAFFAGTEFEAESLVHAPCEMTEGYTGILARGSRDSELAAAELDFDKRLEVVGGYPLLKLLNPAAYMDLYREGCGSED